MLLRLCYTLNCPQAPPALRNPNGWLRPHLQCVDLRLAADHEPGHCDKETEHCTTRLCMVVCLQEVPGTGLLGQMKRQGTGPAESMTTCWPSLVGEKRAGHMADKIMLHAQAVHVRHAQ